MKAHKLTIVTFENQRKTEEIRLLSSVPKDCLLWQHGAYKYIFSKHCKIICFIFPKYDKEFPFIEYMMAVDQIFCASDENVESSHIISWVSGPLMNQ